MIRKKQYRRFYSQRRFGVELEMGSEIAKKNISKAIQEISSHSVRVTKYSTTNNNNYWHVKEDATCGRMGRGGPKGVEVASYIGCGSNDISHIASVASALHRLGCRTNNNCGLHIHAEVADLDTEQLAKVAAWWIKLEKIIGLSLPSRRISNAHCRFTFPCFLDSLTKHGVTIERNDSIDASTFMVWVSPKNLGYFDNDERRQNLSFMNVVRAMKSGSPNRRTLELRWPEGTLDQTDIRCWVKVFLSFIESAKKLPMPGDLRPLALREALCCLGLLDQGNQGCIYSHSILECRSWLLQRIACHAPESVGLYHRSEIDLLIRQAKRMQSLT